MGIEFAKKDQKQSQPSSLWAHVGFGGVQAVGAGRGIAGPSAGRPASGSKGPKESPASDAPSLESLGIAKAGSEQHTPAQPPPAGGVLVVGMGDVARGDDGIGVHLTGCLAAMDWPNSVEFCTAGPDVPERAEKYARVVLLEAIDGPHAPGALYQADPDELLDSSVGGPEDGLGLLSMLSLPVRRRLSIYGIQPHRRDYGSDISDELILAMPSLVPYLRVRILEAAADTQLAN